MDFLSADPDFRTQVAEQSAAFIQTLWASGTKDVSVSKLNLYQRLLLSGFPFPEAKSFVRNLILLHDFSIVETFKTFASLCGDFEGLFIEWLSTQRTDPLNGLAWSLEAQVTLARQAGLEGAIEPAAIHYIAQNSSAEQFLSLALEVNFATLKPAFIKTARETIAQGMKANNTIIANPFIKLIGTVAGRAKFCQPDITQLVQAFLTCLAVSKDSDYRAAAIYNSSNNQYWPQLLQLFPGGPAVQAAYRALLQLDVDVKVGAIMFRDFDALSTPSSLSLVSAMTSGNLEGMVQKWKTTLDQKETQCKELENTLAKLFPTDKLQLVSRQCVKEKNQAYGTMSLADILRLPEYVHQLCGQLNANAGLNNSVLYQSCLRASSASQTSINEESALQLMMKAREVLLLQLQTVRDPEGVSLSQVFSVFNGVTDICAEITALQFVVADSKLADRLRTVLEHHGLSELLANLCRALPLLEQTISLTCKELYPVCEEFLALNSQGADISLANYYQVCIRFAAFLDIRKPRYFEFGRLLCALADHRHTELVKYLQATDEELFYLIEEMQGTKEINISANIVSNFQAIQELLKMVAGKTHFRYLLAALEEFFVSREAKNITEALGQCSCWLPDLRNLESTFTSLEMSKVKQIKAILTYSLACLETTNQAEVTIEVNGAKCTFEELKQLQARCALLLHSADTGSHVEELDSLRQFTTLMKQLFACAAQLDRLKGLGVPLPAQYSCQIWGGRSRNAESLKQENSRLMEQWKQALERQHSYQ
ncbi:MAG: hypothetical protein J0651_03620, partial [Actinobacteria bacterium]|nr:hypothetical protein [Actinomycetota bacterium]